MPLFLIEFYGDLEGYIRKEADMIAGANTIDELMQKLDNAADRYNHAVIYILREGHYRRTLSADLREWRELRDEEARQKNNDSLR